jgi:hypothetical protein
VALATCPLRRTVLYLLGGKMQLELKTIYDNSTKPTKIEKQQSMVEQYINDEVFQARRQSAYNWNDPKSYSKLRKISYRELNDYGFVIASYRYIDSKRRSWYDIEPKNFQPMPTMRVYPLESCPGNIEIYLERLNENRAKIYLVRRGLNKSKQESSKIVKLSTRKTAVENS